MMPMFPDSLFIAGQSVINAIAEQNYGLVWEFIGRHKNTCHKIGGRDAFFCELAEAYMQGIEAFIYRKRKHRKLKISTFVWKALTWAISDIWRDSLIRIPEGEVRESIAALRAKAKRIFHFHGSEGKCTDPALLVEDDHAQRLDAKACSDAIGHALRTLTSREAAVIRARLYNGRRVTYEECGYQFGVTRERIRQVEARAVRKLQHPVRAALLEKFA